MIENIRLSLRGILSHKMRSFLTMLGIIIGIAAMIAIVSTIKGTNDQIRSNLVGSGKNNVTVRLQQGDWEYDMSSGIPAGVPVIRQETLSVLKEIPHVEEAALFRERMDYDGVYHLTASLSGGYVTGVDENYLSTADYTVREGRGLTAQDCLYMRKLAVLDEAAAQQLFSGEPCIGRTIEIRSVPFTVAGVVTEKVVFEPVIETMEDYYTYHQSETGRIFIPSTVWPAVYQYDEPQSVLLRADNTDNMTKIGKEAERILNDGLSVSDSSISYRAKDLLEQAKQLQQLSASTNMMLIWIAGISLLVGGIGVMNIMLVSVTERTGEIGLKKAIGARKKAILAQFLTEAVVLTSIGGILGVITGILLSQLISRINGTPVSISFEAAGLAVMFSMAIGILFGLLPSVKAANLDPIEALRRE